MLEIFQYTFMQRAFLVGTIVGILAPLIGSFLVLRRYSALADTLSHVSLVGVATALILKFSPITTAIVVSLTASLGIEKLRDQKTIFGESVLAIFLSGSLGIVSILISLNKGFNNDLFSYLFGSLTTVSAMDIYVIGFVGLLVLVCVISFYRQFFAVCFDSELAMSSGVRVQRFSLLLIALSALTIAVSLQIIGGLLIGALMIIPVVGAWQFRLSFKNSIYLASMFGLVSTWLGLFASYYLNLSAGGSIVIIALILFLFSLLLGRIFKF